MVTSRLGSDGHQSTGIGGKGLRYNIEVANPAVDWRGNCNLPQEFVVGRVLAKAASGSEYWTEVGWAKHSCLGGQTGPCPYSYDQPQGTWFLFCNSFDLTLGAKYAFRVRHVNGPGQNGIWGQMYYNGVWHTLETNGNMKCQLADGSGNCYFEIYLEVFSDDLTPHPDLFADNDGVAGNQFNTGQFLSLAGAWNSWNQGTIAASAGAVTPYDYCNWTKWHSFSIKKSANCTLP